MKRVLVLILIAFSVEANWKLVYHDEFIEDSSDWSPLYTLSSCVLEKCVNYTAPKTEIVSGTFAITDPQTNNLNRTLIEYSSFNNEGLFDFKYGRYEVRAAQPKGTNIWTEILLEMNWLYFHLMRYTQRSVIEQKLLKHFEGPSIEVPTDVDLNDFHIYSIELNETNAIWKFDDQETFRQNIDGRINGVPKFRILFNFGVGGIKGVNDMTLNETDCPSFLLDYVRYYQWSEERVENNVTTNSIDRNDICEQIKIS